ncbi:MAG: hypothetical protein ACP5PB_09885 [Acidimicrobiales bacterium]
MLTTVGVLVVALGALALVWYWSGRYGGRARRGTTSLRRGPGAHTTARGQPKVAYPTRADAEAHAHQLARRGGVAMSAYRCPTCGQWHVGHTK